MPTENLSPHFTLAEFTYSDTAKRRGILNQPNNAQIAAAEALCVNVLEPLRAHFKRPVKILSGFRNPALNKAVGGAASSQHLKGEAADITLPGISNADVWKYIVANLPYDQVIAEKLLRADPAAGWVHVSYAPALRHDAISYYGGRYVPGLKLA